MASSSSAASVVIVGSPADNDGESGSSNTVNNNMTMTGLLDDDSFTVVNSLGSSYLERFQHLMNDDDSLSSESASDDSSSSTSESNDSSDDDENSTSSSSSSSSSSSESDESEEETADVDDDNHFPVKKSPQTITFDSAAAATLMDRNEGREVTPSPLTKTKSQQQQNISSIIALPSITTPSAITQTTHPSFQQKYTPQQQSHDIQLLTDIIQTKATRSSELSHQARSSLVKSPRERFDDLCDEYIADGEEIVWDLPLWELAAVVLDRLKMDNGVDDSSGSRKEEEGSSSSGSSSSSSSSSSDSSSSSSSSSDSSCTSSSSSSEEDDEEEEEEEDSIQPCRREENSVNTIKDCNNGSQEIYSASSKDSPMSSSQSSSPSDHDSVAVHFGTGHDVGTQEVKTSTTVDNSNDTIAAAAAAAALSVEQRDENDDDVAPPNKKRKLSPVKMQPTSCATALDSSIYQNDDNNNDDDDDANQVDFHGSQDRPSFDEDSPLMASPSPSSSPPLGNSDNAVVCSDVGTTKQISPVAEDNNDGTAAVAAAAATLFDEVTSDNNEVITPSNNKKRKVSQEEVPVQISVIAPALFAVASDSNSLASFVEKDVGRSGGGDDDDDIFNEVDFQGSQDNQSVNNKDSSKPSSSSPLDNNVAVNSEPAAVDGTRKISADDNNNLTTTNAASASYNMKARGAEVVAPSKGKRTFSQVESQPAASEEVVVVVSAASKKREIASSSSSTDEITTPPSFTDRATRTLLFHEGDQQPSPANWRPDEVPRNWMSYYDTKANLAMRKEFNVDVGNDSHKEHTTKAAVQPRKESANKMINKKRSRKICTIKSCTSQARGRGLCQRHGSKASLCKFEGCANQVINGGVCIRHGAQVAPKIKGPRLRCSVETCTNFAKSGGLCIRHGAADQRKRCSYEGCRRQAQRGGFCLRHGAQMFCDEVIGGTTHEGELYTSPEKDVPTRKRIREV